VAIAAAADRHSHVLAVCIAIAVVRLADAELLEETRELRTVLMRWELLRPIDQPVEARVAGQFLRRGGGKQRVADLAIVTRFLRRLRDERCQRAGALVAERAGDVGHSADHGHAGADDRVILVTRHAIAEVRHRKLRARVVMTVATLRA